FAHAGDRPLETRPVALLHLGADLTAQPECEPPLGQELEVPRLMGQLDRVPGEGDGHIGGQLERGRGPGGQDEGGEHVVRTLERERPVDPERLQATGVGGRVLEAGQLGVELHRPMLPPTPTRCRRGRPEVRTSEPWSPTVIRTRWHTGAMAPLICTPDEAVGHIGATDTIGFGLGPANPDAFLTAMSRRDDWVDLTVGGALLLGYYAFLAHPGVSYRCGFFRPAERILLAGGANIELVPGGFRQFAPILRRYNPRVMTVLAAPPH